MAITTQLSLRTPSALRATSTALTVLLLSTLAAAQTNFPEVEPNSLKSEASPALGMTAGDTLSGTTTGIGAVAGDTSLTSGDVFRVRTKALPLGIYRHTLTLTTATATGHTGSIRGLNQTGTVGTGGTAGTVDTGMQTSSATTVPPRFNAWYGFGKQEEIYYRVTGASTTTAAYTATLATTGVVPIVVGTPFNPGPITMTTVGLTTVDTDMWLYDHNLNAIATAGNDDQFGSTVLQSHLVRTLSVGVYHLAVSRWDLANNQPAAADDDFVLGGVLDFPNALVCSSSTATGTLMVSVSDGTTTTPVTLPNTMPYEVQWVSFSVTGTDTILPGTDIFVSPPGESSLGFASTPLPPGFFGPGSDPFTSTVPLSGSPLLGTGLPGGTDTIVRRLAPLPFGGGCPGIGAVPIEIVALNLVSASPIPVTFFGGSSTSLYELRASVSSQAISPIGNMQIRRTAIDGGTFDSNLPVIPRVVFTKVSGVNGQPVIVVDPAPSVFLQVLNAPWSYDDGGIGVPQTPGGLVDHDVNSATPLIPFGPTSNFVPGLLEQGGNCGLPGVSPRRVRIVHTAPDHTHVVTPPTQPPPPVCVIFCQGDGTLFPCPCGNISIIGDDKGCLNSMGIGGALRCSGNAFIAADTFQLNGSNIPNGPGLYFQANALGSLPFGDGRLCATTGIIRMAVVFAANNASSYPPGLPIHIAGGPIFPGDLKHYQLWYRDSAAFCVIPATFNTTNGVSVQWAP